MSSSELKDIATKLLSLAKGEQVGVQIESKRISHLRLARNSISTCGEETSIDIQVKVYKGTKIGTASTSELSDQGLTEVIKRAQLLAEALPEDLEFVPLLEPPQVYEQVSLLDQERIDLEAVCSQLQKCLALSEQSKTILAGFFSSESTEQIFTTSSGLVAQYQQTLARYSVTARNIRGSRSGKANKETNRISDLDFLEITQKAIQLCVGGKSYPTSEELVELPPGEYTTILSPSAVADMLRNLLNFMDQRQAAEGRSYFSKASLGEKLFPSKIQLYSNPRDILAPAKPFSKDGIPLQSVAWINAGNLTALPTDRFWAQKCNLSHIPIPSNLILSGGNDSLENMIANTQHGILIAHLWYIRIVDLQQALLTGLTRDGVYLIQHGKIVAPVKNFRFNESPVEMLKRTTALTQSERAWGNESEDLIMAVPWLKVDGFRFTSISDAV